MHLKINCLLLLFFVGILRVGSQTIGQNLDFETTACTANSCTASGSNLPGWLSSGSPEIVVKQLGCNPSGNWSLNMSPGSHIQQNLVTQVGATYTLSWRTWSQGGNLDITLGSNVTSLSYNTGSSNKCVTWNTTSVSFVARSSTTALQITASNTQIYIDNVTVIPWPYPAANCYTPCSSDADCSNRGVCTNSQNDTAAPRYCACYAGFSGCRCEREPAVSCYSNYQQVDTMSLNFNTNPSIRYQYPNLYVTVNAVLEETPLSLPSGSNSPPYSLQTISYFGGNRTAYPNCSYPNNPLWQKYPTYPGNCQDQYTLNVSWTDALNLCGFYLIPGTKSYTQTLTMERYYLLTDTGVGRIERHTRNFTVIFPQEVDLSTVSITLSGIPNFRAAVTFLEYNPSTEIWTVVVLTTLQTPYVIQNHVIGAMSGLISTQNRFFTSELQNISGCESSSQTCTQQVTFKFWQGTAPASCTGLYGTLLTNLTLTCDNSIPQGNCNLTQSQTAASFTINLYTGNSCPTTNTIQFSAATLQSFADPQLTTPKTSFLFTEVAYFGVLLQSTQAVITSKQIKPNTMCFQATNGTCIPANYSLIGVVGAYEPVFSVNFAAPENAGIFNPVSVTSYQAKVTVTVAFLGAKGLKESNPSNVNQELSLEVYVQPTSPTPSAEVELDSGSSSQLNFSAMFLFVCFSLLWM